METTGPIPGLSGMLGRTKRGLEQTVANLVGQGVHQFFVGGGQVKGTTISLVYHFVVLNFVEIGGWVKRTFHTPCHFEEDAESFVQGGYF